MKILHVVPTYLPAWRHGGPVVAVHGLAKALVERGHEVSVFTTNLHGDGVLPVPPGKPVAVEGVEVTYFEVSGSRRLHRSPDLKSAARARVGEFDIAHLHSIFLAPTRDAARACEDAQVPYVVAPRGMLVKDLVRRRGRLRKALWMAFVERHTLEHAAAIHATTQLEADEAAKFRYRLPPVHVVANGVDLEPLKLREWSQVEPRIHDILDHGPYFLFLGRLSWKKGLDRLVEAMARLEGADLVIAGPDDENLWPTLSAKAHQLGIGGRVHFVGMVGGAEKSALLRAALALVLPSYSENFGNSALEAMAVGTAVIVTPEVGLADVVRTSGAGIVVSGLPQPLGEAMRTIAEATERRKAMGARGAAVAAERFAWSAVAEQMEGVYGSVLGDRGGRGDRDDRGRRGAAPRSTGVESDLVAR
jgi:glycosyltransferase involved in cell wall biosynthesis